jgi:hypothetical protein
MDVMVQASVCEICFGGTHTVMLLSDSHLQQHKAATYGTKLLDVWHIVQAVRLQRNPAMRKQIK